MNLHRSERNCHHYVLAHIVLRKVFKLNPVAFFNVLLSPGRESFLESVWRNVCRICESDGAPSFDISDVGITNRLINGFPGMFFTMPPPENPAEAYFVGIVLNIDSNGESLREQPEFVYMTLEKGLDFGGTDRTFLCEWTDKAHSNYGDGPLATLEAFISAVERQIRQRYGPKNGNV